MISKKAFEIQFNWIFVLVAGAVILLFFTVVIVKQKDISQLSTKATVLKSIEAIIIGASVSTDTINTIDIPNSKIEIDCNRVSLSGVSKQYQNLLLFAPSLIKGSQIITQTLAFSVPYRATNLLYMTSPQLQYIIISENAFASEINKSMPSDLKKEVYKDISQIKISNNNNIRFIFFGSAIDLPKSLEKIPDPDVTAIKINGNNEKGTIEFYQKDVASWTFKGSSVYIGKQSLIGAVYTDNIDTYKCNMENAFSRLKIVTNVYIGRTKKLMQELVLTGKQSSCKEIYNNALKQLNRILAASSNFDSESIDTIADASQLLTVENQEAKKLSCTLIY